MDKFQQDIQIKGITTKKAITIIEYRIIGSENTVKEFKKEAKRLFANCRFKKWK